MFRHVFVVNGNSGFIPKSNRAILPAGIDLPVVVSSMSEVGVIF